MVAREDDDDDDDGDNIVGIEIFSEPFASSGGPLLAPGYKQT